MARKPKRKTPSIAFHRNFVEPSTEDRSAALGAFPGAPHTAKSREKMILPHTNGRPSLLESKVTTEEALHAHSTVRNQTCDTSPKQRA
mmetsp:Transcript_33982/g.49781  ORF Transcript_33982/g.49781 Transcript_33982/m.49781 type:complete len:88 (+) Transcript_33982:71-334(+)